MTYRKCKQTISIHGAKAGEPTRATARCYAGRVTAENHRNNQPQVTEISNSKFNKEEFDKVERKDVTMEDMEEMMGQVISHDAK